MIAASVCQGQDCPDGRCPIRQAFADRPIVQAVMPPYVRNNGYAIGGGGSTGGCTGQVATASYGSNGGGSSGGSTGTIRSRIQARKSSGGGCTGMVQQCTPVQCTPIVQCEVVAQVAPVVSQDCGCGSSVSHNGRSSFADTLNASGVLYHDHSYGGAEVVYRSSGVATESAARSAWMRSPGHRRLLMSGKITQVTCVGNVCVGR